jgi:AcrR family transcriptional regulator
MIHEARSQRADILATAGRLVAARGIGISLNAVAEAAGVSKGGLMYHFPTKNDLLVALATQMLEDFRARVLAAAGAAPGGPGRLLRAYVDVTCDDIVRPDAVERTALMGALFANPQCHALIEADARRWEDDLVADGLHPERARLIMLAADGLSMLSGFRAGDAELDRIEEQRVLLHDLSRRTGRVVGEVRGPE